MAVERSHNVCPPPDSLAPPLGPKDILHQLSDLPPAPGVPQHEADDVVGVKVGSFLFAHVSRHPVLDSVFGYSP